MGSPPVGTLMMLFKSAASTVACWRKEDEQLRMQFQSEFHGMGINPIDWNQRGGTRMVVAGRIYLIGGMEDLRAEARAGKVGISDRGRGTSPGVFGSCGE